MQAESGPAANWREAAHYAPLLDADRTLFAWEWLRRDPDYRAAARQADPATRRAQGTGSERFGLVAFEPPDLPAPVARPVWDSSVCPQVLSVRAGESRLAPDRFDPSRFGRLARLIASGRGEHLLISDGLRAIRLDGPGGTFTTGPVSLRYALAGLVSAERPLLTLRRFLALCGTGRFSRSLHRRETRARRWILLLRTRDALEAGASQREIAEELLSRSAGEPHWRARESSIRSQVQRLVRSARCLAAGGFRAMLQ